LHKCAGNTLTSVGNTVVYKYFVASGEAHDYMPDVLSSVAGCALTGALEFKVNNVWTAYNPNVQGFVTAFDATTGVLTVDADSFEGQQGASVDLEARITMTDPNSASGSNSVTDEFVVTLTNPCTAAEVAWDAQQPDIALTI
jgi:hypothetical protein